MARASGGSRVGAQGPKGRGRAGQLRLIAGRFRGRKLPVPDHAGLRPTTDRVRETLFNWLAPNIAGSRCLDCFAGSGALGFEALSRGAAHVVLVERAAGVAAQLRRNAATLTDAGADGSVDVIQADAQIWLRHEPPGAFDILFLDPPFDDAAVAATCRLLQRGFVREGSLVYIETPSSLPAPELPPDWSLLRERRAGQVRFALAEVGPQVRTEPA